MPMTDDELRDSLEQLQRAHQRHADESVVKWRHHQELHDGRARDEMDRAYYDYINTTTPESTVTDDDRFHSPTRWPLYYVAIVCAVCLLIFVCIVLSLGISSPPRIVVPFATPAPTVQSPE